MRRFRVICNGAFVIVVVALLALASAQEAQKSVQKTPKAAADKPKVVPKQAEKKTQEEVPLRSVGLNRTIPVPGVRADAAKRLSDDPTWNELRNEQFAKLGVTTHSLAARAAGADDADMVLPVQRIFGGVFSKPDEFPGCVAVNVEGGLCTGTLVAPRIVISAAHCLFDGNKRVAAKTVFVGLNAGKQADGHVYNVIKSVPHPDYKSSIGRNDIAVLVLEKEVDGSHAKPHRIVSNFPSQGICTLVGYGFTEKKVVGRQSNVTVPFLTGNCNSFGCFSGIEFVAGEPQHSKDTCNGDSGGPAFIKVDKDWLLAGVTSRAILGAGIDPGTGKVCGDGGIYVRPDQFKDFIDKTAKDNNVESPFEKPPEVKPDVESEEAKARARLIESLELLLKMLKEKK